MSSFKLHSSEKPVKLAEMPASFGQDAKIIALPTLTEVERTYHDLYREFVKTALHNGGCVLDLDIVPPPIPVSAAALEPYQGPAC
jgi:hypothetical protein